ncbi:MAG TPA: pyruvate kinase [Candidatus Saccharimonadales bacterium]|nr:pyruvate kinase [Candidatus Saccharimonadales bacterium]
MQGTDIAPKVPIASFKRTKIIATIGPSTGTAEAMYKLLEAGTNGFRFNFSHGTHEEREKQIPWIRQASVQLGKPVAIIQDLQGPKVRLGDFDGTITVKAGQTVTFQYKADYAVSGHIPTQYDLAEKVRPGERIYVFDGRVRSTVSRVHEGVVHAIVENDGYMIKRKGMNLPDTDFQGDILTKKDIDDIRFGATQDIDYVALSFVQSPDDIERLRSMLRELGSEAKIIAKIETKAAVDNIEAIVQAADAVMVARGDLAVETPAESVPVVQRQITQLGRVYAKPVIIATQMLLSMVEAPEPTRAEVSDVATAVFTGADCVMLSDETANGERPIESVETMKRIIQYVEQRAAPDEQPLAHMEHAADVSYAVASGALTLAYVSQAKAIIAETKTGKTALLLASSRPTRPLIAVTSEARTAQQLALVYGVKSYIRAVQPDTVMRFIAWMRERAMVVPGETVVAVSGNTPGVAGTTDTIRVHTIM